ncbi:MAG: PEP-CTERM sorting domain-containing protein [Planctomycetota bacterium]|nr:PEP-CTERM sorting domain-containing protein [Planctomycetota bacterium]
MKSKSSIDQAAPRETGLPSRNQIIISRIFVVLCLIASFASNTSADIFIQGFDASSNDRFANNPLFVLNGRNLSGVGLTNGGGFNGYGIWATLISPNIVISANHNIPNSPIFFYPNNNPGTTPFSYSVVSSQRIGTTDLWLGQLNAPVDASISYYAFATEFLSGPPPSPDPNLVAAGSLQGENGYVFGVSPTARIPTQDVAVGRNLITGYIENIFAPDINSTLDLLYLNRDASNPAGFEAAVQPGDSGAPFFIERAGSPLLLGVNSVLFGTVANPTATGVSYLGNDAIAIQAFINASAVPEPSTLMLLGLGAAMLGSLRFRSVA